MRLTARAVTLSLCLSLTAALLAGCGDVGNQLKAERVTFNGVLTGIHAGHVAGAVPASTERAALPYLRATQASLDAGDDAYISGDKSTASVYLKSARTGVVKLNNALKATTQPVK